MSICWTKEAIRGGYFMEQLTRVLQHCDNKIHVKVKVNGMIVFCNDSIYGNNSHSVEFCFMKQYHHLEGVDFWIDVESMQSWISENKTCESMFHIMLKTIPLHVGYMTLISTDKYMLNPVEFVMYDKCTESLFNVKMEQRSRERIIIQLQMDQRKILTLINKNQNQPSSKPEKSPECCICYESNLLQWALIPCGHVCTCEKCTQKLSDCPICRKKVESFIKIFSL